MKLIEILKGAWSRMIGPKNLESVLHVSPAISSKMKEAIELWERMYMDESPWLNENVKSLGLPALISSEKARTATIEMKVKITGESEKAEFIRTNFNKVLNNLRKQLEYGIAFGGFVIKPYVLQGPYGDYVMEFNYTSANNFYPFSFSSEGKITEAAFVDMIIAKDRTYSKVEYHKLDGTTLTINNYAFVSKNMNTASLMDSMDLGDPIPLNSVPAWANLEAQVVISDIDCLLFAYFKMPEANTVDLQSPLGASGFSRAVSLIEEADKLYSDLLWEFEGGQLAVDVDRTALNPMKDAKGKTIEVLPKLQDRLFRRSLDLGNDSVYNVFNPSLRDSSILNGLNNQLMKIEDVCFLSRGTISIVTSSEAKTATELKILKQRSFSANQDIQKELQNTLEAVFNIMDKYCELYNIVPDGEYEVAYNWDDSIIVDKDSERQQDLLDVNAGLMSKVEYRMKWFGETEQQAMEALERINEEKIKAAEIQMIGTANAFAGNDNDNQPTSKAQEDVDKRARAKESGEITEPEE